MVVCSVGAWVTVDFMYRNGIKNLLQRNRQNGVRRLGRVLEIQLVKPLSEDKGEANNFPLMISYALAAVESSMAKDGFRMPWPIAYFATMSVDWYTMLKSCPDCWTVRSLSLTVAMALDCIHRPRVLVKSPK